MQGYRQALHEHGLDIDGELVRLMECECASEGGFAAFEQFYVEGRLPTAIVAMADIIAIGVLDAAEKHQLGIPNQLSLVGYDDLPIARWLNPPLTTVQQPVFEKGQRATESLLQLMNGENPGTEIMLPTRLIARASVATIS